MILQKLGTKLEVYDRRLKEFIKILSKIRITRFYFSNLNKN